MEIARQVSPEASSVSALLARSTRTAGTTGAMIYFVRAGVAHPEHHFGYAIHILRRY